jgi:hypothetical protein
MQRNKTRVKTNEVRAALWLTRHANNSIQMT